MEYNKAFNLLDEKLSLLYLFFTCSFVAKASFSIKLENDLHIALPDISDPTFQFASSHVLFMNSTHPSSSGNSMDVSSPGDSSAASGGSDSVTGTGNPPVTSGSSNPSVTSESSTILTTSVKGTEKSSEQPEKNSIEAEQTKARTDFNNNIYHAYIRLGETRKLLNESSEIARRTHLCYEYSVKDIPKVTTQHQAIIKLSEQARTENTKNVKQSSEYVEITKQLVEEIMKNKLQNYM